MNGSKEASNVALLTTLPKITQKHAPKTVASLPCHASTSTFDINSTKNNYRDCQNLAILQRKVQHSLTPLIFILSLRSLFYDQKQAKCMPSFPHLALPISNDEPNPSCLTWFKPFKGGKVATNPSIASSNDLLPKPTLSTTPKDDF